MPPITSSSIITHLLLKDTIQAWQTLEVYDTTFKDDSFAEIQKMELSLARKKFDEVLAYYTIIAGMRFQSRQNISDALYLKGLAHLGKNEPQLAYESFSKAIDEGLAINYINLHAYYQRGKYYWETGKRKRAVSDFSKLREHGYKANPEYISLVLDAGR